MVHPDQVRSAITQALPDATVDLRLAALLRRMNQPEVAVPLLVEVVQIMTPASALGQKAYQNLLELGFVSTPYAGSAATPGS